MVLSVKLSEKIILSFMGVLLFFAVIAVASGIFSLGDIADALLAVLN